MTKEWMEKAIVVERDQFLNFGDGSENADLVIKDAAYNALALDDSGTYKFLSYTEEGNELLQPFNDLEELCDNWYGEADMCPSNDALVVMTFESFMESVKKLILKYKPDHYDICKGVKKA